MPEIVLATLNARYAHAAMGLRCLRANLGEWRESSVIVEFVIGQKTEEMVEQILALKPRHLGLGVYIWNVTECTRLVAQLKVVAPELTIILGGPEVSHEIDQQRICQLADYVISGWGDVSFADLIGQLQAGLEPPAKTIAGVQPPLDRLALPYAEYSDQDLAGRHLYVEASRGCPFKCAFCLSALDLTAWAFPLTGFLAALEHLYQRGARQFKFVDRTFNLKVSSSIAILQFFLDKITAAPDDPPFAHFELIPDHLPERLKAMIRRFPPGTLQFEIGIQSFNPEVQALISRRQDNAAAAANIAWLRSESGAHLHVDLIAGLPGEDLASFAAGFDRLVALAPHEIQFGILKRLRGTPLAQQAEALGLRFSPDPPYPILANRLIDFPTMQRLNRFARYFDLIANSGRYPLSLPLLLGDRPFVRFLAFADWLYAETRQTHAFAQERLVERVYRYLCEHGQTPPASAAAALLADYRGSGGRSRLGFEAADSLLPKPAPRRTSKATPSRQSRHLGAGA
ncbi:MAG: radical SAM protein [Lysobacterales bacterium]